MVKPALFQSTFAWLVSVVLLVPLGTACSASSGSDVFDRHQVADSSDGDGPTVIPGDGSGGGGSGTTEPLPSGSVTLSGRVMAPSGAFPVSGALVYLTKDTPEAIPKGVYHYECDEMEGTAYALSSADGTWTIKNVQVGNWNLVTRKGNFRRVRPIEVKQDMDPNVHPELTMLPRKRSNDGLDVIPSFAVVKTNPDLAYNLLAKFGLGDVNGAGNLVQGTESFDIYDEAPISSYPHTKVLFDSNNLHNYHMVFLPCSATSVGVPFVNNNVQKLRDYVSVGGRIYNSCTVSLWTKAPFPPYIDYYGNNTPNRFDIGRSSNTAYSTTGAALDPGLAAWLPIVAGVGPNAVPFHNGYVTINGTVDVSDGHGLNKDDGVVKPYTWVRDLQAHPDKPLMVTYNYDFGKVFYSVYETSTNTAVMTPQEYVLLYVILEVGVCENLPPGLW